MCSVFRTNVASPQPKAGNLQGHCRTCCPFPGSDTAPGPLDCPYRVCRSRATLLLGPTRHTSVVSSVPGPTPRLSPPPRWGWGSCLFVSGLLPSFVGPVSPRGNAGSCALPDAPRSPQTAVLAARRGGGGLVGPGSPPPPPPSRRFLWFTPRPWGPRGLVPPASAGLCLRSPHNARAVRKTSGRSRLYHIA